MNYKMNCEHCKKKLYDQEYRQANKDRLKEYGQAYRQKNKQRISERDKQKTECGCGSIVRRRDITKHNRSKKHTEYLNSR